MTCGKLLKEGQWWHFCGETDMGQTPPALCTECGGRFELASPEIQAEHQRKKAERMAELERRRGNGATGGYLYTGEGRNEIPNGLLPPVGGIVWVKKRPDVTLGMQPKWLMVKQEDGTIKTVANPDYVEPPLDEPDEEDEDDSAPAGHWCVPAPFGKTMLSCERKPSWIKRMAVKWATGWTWEDYK